MNYNKIQKLEAPSFGWPKSSSFINCLIGFVICLVVILSLANLVGTNTLATQGVVLDQILSETEKINKENQTLAVEIGKVANLSYIQSAATDLGFVRVKSNLIIGGDEALAAAR